MQVAQYEYLPGAQELLQQLQQAGHEMHIVSNYPVWYEWIEEKLRLSQYLPWTFVSCKPPMQVRGSPDVSKRLTRSFVCRRCEASRDMSSDLMKSRCNCQTHPGAL